MEGPSRIPCWGGCQHLMTWRSMQLQRRRYLNHLAQSFTIAGFWGTGRVTITCSLAGHAAPRRPWPPG